MEAKLRKDSVEKNETYFIRVNHVKRMEFRSEDSKTVTEYDRYGNEICSKWYLDNELISVSESVYNEFGDIISYKATYLDDYGKPETVSLPGVIIKLTPPDLQSNVSGRNRLTLITAAVWRWW